MGVGWENRVRGGWIVSWSTGFLWSWLRTVPMKSAVRNHDHKKPVDQLSYEAHPDALEHLRKVAERVCEDPSVTALAAVHRTGDLKIGDAAVIVAVAASHREVAFAACRRLIDDLKAEVPIWKHQHFTDGASEWVGAH